MIVDTSALVAILRGEPEAVRFLEAIENEPTGRMSAASFFETAIVVDGSRDPVLSRRLDEFIEAAGFVIEPVTARQAQIARAAYRDFGKGGGHPAGLNFGDCFAYALAKEKSEALLFKGDDFTHTDVEPALK
ncbi:type II toxin-antitoxin system VapC family toxin [Starkeya koreensis]|uniref:Ribonuclease VapC n=1 Tax=Ancylobacter koreensis TaxID=266121 RepID=A0ABT0DNE9_9HYPH|nr:type II toxin-antitoxin system VapC family toxin [Ancylobacter koreensis]MCK0208796.1 type II toxin-antitoxin system VapC family toxin [Ancylobacter koreensis]